MMFNSEEKRESSEFGLEMIFKLLNEDALIRTAYEVSCAHALTNEQMLVMMVVELHKCKEECMKQNIRLAQRAAHPSIIHFENR